MPGSPEGTGGKVEEVRRRRGEPGKSEEKSEKGGAARRKVKKVWDGRRSPKKLGEAAENREE